MMMESLKAHTLRMRVLVVILIMAAAAGAEFSMGRKLWGVAGQPGFWSSDIWSQHNSQYFLDPYTLTHILHGVMFYALLSLVLRNLPVTSRMVIAVGLEAGWEVLENTNFIIERYRTAGLRHLEDPSSEDQLALFSPGRVISMTPDEIRNLADKLESVANQLDELAKLS